MEFFRSPPPAGGCHPWRGNASRRCGFECLEPRQLLAADLVGAADLSLSHPGGATGSLGGSVFAAQAGANCHSLESSPRLADVRVQLLNEAGAVLEERRTDERGAYRFVDLLPGQYTVRQIVPQGFLEGAAHLGGGGGVALGSNQVSEIDVQSHETLEGYDFCAFASVAEPAVQALPYLSLSLPPAPISQAEVFEEPTIESTTDATPVERAPLGAARSEEVFGGSSRSLQAPEGIKAWDEFPSDELFLMTNYLELAAAQLPTLETFEPILKESLSSEPEESIDAPFADSYPANPLDYWEGEARLELGQWMGDADIIDQEAEPAEPTPQAVPKIARLHEARLYETNPPQ